MGDDHKVVYDAIFFDVGSVILYDFPMDPPGTMDNWKNDLAVKYGFESGAKLHHAIYETGSWKKCKIGGMTFKEMVATEIPHLNDEQLNELMVDYRRGLQVHPKLAAIVQKLKEQCPPQTKLCILSNFEDTLMDVLNEKAKDVLPMFDHVFNSYDLHYAKPEPQVYELCMTKQGLEPGKAKCLLIDDKKRNTLAATESVGWDGFVYKNNPEELEAFFKAKSILYD
jgi:FMN phosphatase YigB (HAD superfamily)